MSSRRSRFIGLLFGLLICGQISAQIESSSSVINPSINSPFSRFGLGDFVSQFYAAQAGMGGLSAAFQDPYHINMQNPASLASLRATAFEVGIGARYSNWKSPTLVDNQWSGNLNYLVLGFPLFNPINEALYRKDGTTGLGMSFALVPYTQVGYDIQSSINDDNFNVATNTLKGKGGTYRFRWGNAFRYKGFSAGVNMNYSFGKITANRKVSFDSLRVSYDTEFLDEFSIGVIGFDVGLQYRFRIDKPSEDENNSAAGQYITLGVVGNNKNELTTNSSRYYHRDNLTNYTTDIRDTLVYERDIEELLTLPAEISFGLTYEKVNKLKLGVEYSIGNWSQYGNEAKEENLMDTYQFTIGAEFIPNILSYNNYFERVYYRAGFYYGTDPRHVDGLQLKKLGLTFGVGFPIVMPRQQVSFFDVSFEIGQFGLSEVLNETYGKLTLGFTLNDNTWFLKRKFN